MAFCQPRLYHLTAHTMIKNFDVATSTVTRHRGDLLGSQVSKPFNLSEGTRRGAESPELSSLSVGDVKSGLTPLKCGCKYPFRQGHSSDLSLPACVRRCEHKFSVIPLTSLLQFYISLVRDKSFWKCEF